MDLAEADKLVKQLAAGFEVLQDEYQKLHGQHQALERKLATAREQQFFELSRLISLLQYNELAKLYGSGASTTPPLSLSSSPNLRQGQPTEPQTITEVLAQRSDSASKEAADTIRVANTAVTSLRLGLPKEHPTNTDAEGVRIWSGPSADRLEAASARIMPSISESPLEQDFTIEGKPSKLGCPFASMANKKLSSHAASVLSRYNPGSNGGGAASTPLSSVSANRVNGKESFAAKSANQRRSSFVDPIAADGICGLSSGHLDEESPHSERVTLHSQLQEKQDATNAAEVGVCPIRFLDQHSPEEVATYFERHKHELPRSHEVCVKRYQTNEKQIRELDAKYGSLVSMIQGLGAKHKELLPDEPADDAVDEDGRSAEKVRKWASSVSAQAAVDGEVLEEEEQEERLPHFERPLRDIRVGESPSRPWGIPVPVKYLEAGGAGGSQTSSRPVQVTSPLGAANAAREVKGRKEKAPAPAKCPFGFDKNEKSIRADVDETLPSSAPKARPTFIAAPDPGPVRAPGLEQVAEGLKDNAGRMVFTGPVFIGYSAEDAAKILRDSGLGAR